MSETLSLDAAPFGLEALLRAKGFERLTPVQSAVLDPDLDGKDLGISSQTGSGKTIALGFVLAKSVAGGPPPSGPGGVARPTVLIIAPTRELATQLGRELGWLYAPLKANVVVVMGGTSPLDERRLLARKPAVVVGTPGRLLDHVRRGGLSLEGLSAIVLDEADELLDMGFEEDIDAIFEHAPKERRTHLVSATFGPRVRAMAARFQTAPVSVCGTTPGVANADIEHVAMWVAPKDRADAIVNILLRNPDDKTLIFVRTRVDTQDLARSLGERGFAVRALSGDMTQRERTSTFADFQSGPMRVLVATDVAARGLDVENIARVIQYDLPESADVFTHRSGRTGRAGRAGQNVALVSPRMAGRFESLVRGAKVRAKFIDVPSAAEIRAAADERLRASVGEAVDSGVASAELRSLAERMLEDRNPADVVAALLARSSYEGPCAPCEVASAKPRATSDGKRPDRFTAGRDEFARPRSSRGPFVETPGYVRFQVSWGASEGADARRILALVCRRGGISSEAVGTITVAPRSSSIEVAMPLAERFESAVQRPDRRDPRVRFRRWQATAPGAARPARAAHG